MNLSQQFVRLSILFGQKKYLARKIVDKEICQSKKDLGEQNFHEKNV